MKDRVARRHRPPLSTRQKKALLAVHVISGGAWLGAAFCMLIISWTNQDPAHHYAVNLVLEKLDGLMMIPAPMVAIGSGLLLSWGTVWGFFRWYWLLLKQLLTYAMVVLAPFTVHDWIGELTSLSRAGRTSVDYESFHQLHVFGSVIIVLAGGAVVGLSVLKPWGPRARSRRSSIALEPAGPQSRTGDEFGAAARIPPAKESCCFAQPADAVQAVAAR